MQSPAYQRITGCACTGMCINFLRGDLSKMGKSKNEKGSGKPGSIDPVLTAGGICAEAHDDVDKVKFVDDPDHPRGRGRLDLSTGERF